MKPEDIFIGPMLRRAQDDLVVICLATFKPFDLRFSIKAHGSGRWLAHDASPSAVHVSSGLHFYFAQIRPAQKFPTGKLLAYGIGVKSSGVYDYKPFETIVKTDSLAYGKSILPAFFLPKQRGKLNVFYGSCRKIHDTKGGKGDALSAGDALVAKHFLDVSTRPAILCLGGDQIYADDVHDIVFEEVTTLARRIQPKAEEQLPGPGSALGAGPRTSILKKHAKFTSDDLKHHMARLAEFLALYGLMWNVRNWSVARPSLEHFTRTLPQVRRLLANVPSYMIFDDHDVTDDWNLDVSWRESVFKKPLGRRIVANALMAYWLCQGYGNDPSQFANKVAAELTGLIEKRDARYADAEARFWSLDRWEFSTPTTPFIYFLDTRTKRGAKDDPIAHAPGAPAFLKSVRSWDGTMKRLLALLKRQNPDLPLVLVSAAPVYGFRWIEMFQKFLTFFAGAYKYDFENWAANKRHFEHFLQLLSGRNVVLLSGDLHYGYTSTARFVVFDSRRLRSPGPATTATGVLPRGAAGPVPSYAPVSTAQFIQLTSSALKNNAGGFFTRIPAWLSRTQPATIVTDNGDTVYGNFANGRFVMLESSPTDPLDLLHVLRTPHEVKPVTLFRQRINDAYNSGYLGNYNLGVVSFRDKAVSHYYLTPNGKHSEHSWDFSNDRYWE